MKFIHIFIIVILIGFTAMSCKQTAKNITAEDFIKIQNEVLNTDLTAESKEAVAKKYGFTLKDYTDFEEKIEKDSELKKKVGELRLNIQKDDNKK